MLSRIASSEIRAWAGLIVLTCALVLAFVWESGKASPQGATAWQQDVVSCLVGEDWISNVLKEYGLQVDSKAQVRVSPKLVPGWDDKERGQVYVVFYESGGLRGFFAQATRLPDGRIEVGIDGYRLDRKGGRWYASEGHGGIGTYTAIGRFVSSLEAEPLISVDLTPRRDAKCVSALKAIGGS